MRMCTDTEHERLQLITLVVKPQQCEWGQKGLKLGLLWESKYFSAAVSQEKHLTKSLTLCWLHPPQSLHTHVSYHNLSSPNLRTLHHTQHLGPHNLALDKTLLSEDFMKRQNFRSLKSSCYSTKKENFFLLTTMLAEYLSAWTPPTKCHLSYSWQTGNIYLTFQLLHKCRTNPLFYRLYLFIRWNIWSILCTRRPNRIIQCSLFSWGCAAMVRDAYRTPCSWIRPWQISGLWWAPARSAKGEVIPSPQFWPLALDPCPMLAYTVVSVHNLQRHIKRKAEVPAQPALSCSHGDESQAPHPSCPVLLQDG